MKMKKFYDVKEALEALDVNPIYAPTVFIADGKIHRFDVDKKNDLAGWYIAHDKGMTVGNWKLGIKVYVVHKEKLTTYFDEMEVKKMVSHAQEQQQDIENKLKEIEQIYVNAQPYDPGHGYLVKKKIKLPSLVKQVNDQLLIPLMDAKFNLRSLQYISENGEKRFFPHLPVKGLFFLFPNDSKPFNHDEEETIYLCEGVATGASIFEQTKTTTLCAMFASNLVEVSTAFQKTYPRKKIVVIADNDKNGVGEEKAKQTNLPVILIPEVGKDANDFVNDGGNLLELITSTELINVKKDDTLDDEELIVSAEEFKNIKPLRWLVKNFLPAESLAMVHGQPGSGKSFWSLDLALRVALNVDYHGIPIRNADKRPVVYLSGEGLYGLSHRYQAWCKHYNTEVENIYFSKVTFNFSDTANFQRLKKALAKINPCLIIVDTLNRHWDGDENSSQEAKAMIDACDELKRDFNATVLIVHHTGVSGEAQGRARGSSAWRGALDAEFSISMDNDKRIITVEQKKNKDGELYKPISLWLEKIDLEKKNDDGDEITSCVLIKNNEVHEVNEIKKSKDADLKAVDNLELHNALTSLAKENKARVEEDKITITRKDLIGYFFLKEVDRIKKENDFFDLNLDGEKIKKKAQNIVKSKLRPDSNRWLGRLLKRGTIKQEDELIYIDDQEIIGYVKISLSQSGVKVSLVPNGDISNMSP
jgi:putative DNA primase/helicase